VYQAIPYASELNATEKANSPHQAMLRRALIKSVDTGPDKRKGRRARPRPSQSKWITGSHNAASSLGREGQSNK